MNWFDNATEGYGSGWFSAMEKAYPEMWRCFAKDLNSATLLKKTPSLENVAVIISGGGSDGPLFPGFVGENMADACVIGAPYSAPNAYALYQVGKYLGKQKGILFLYNNFAGDFLNNDFASELLTLEGYNVHSVAASDDIASALPGEPRQDRNGRCSIALLIKISASCASKGHTLDQTAEIVSEANERSATLSVVMDPITKETSFGMGFSGEPGFKKEKFDLDQIAKVTVDLLLNDLKISQKEKVVLLINRLRLTSYADSYYMAEKFYNRLKKTHGIYQMRVGAYNNILDMYGYTVTILEANKRLLPHLEGLFAGDSFMV